MRNERENVRPGTDKSAEDSTRQLKKGRENTSRPPLLRGLLLVLLLLLLLRLSRWLRLVLLLLRLSWWLRLVLLLLRLSWRLRLVLLLLLLLRLSWRLAALVRAVAAAPETELAAAAVLLLLSLSRRLAAGLDGAESWFDPFSLALALRLVGRGVGRRLGLLVAGVGGARTTGACALPPLLLLLASLASGWPADALLEPFALGLNLKDNWAPGSNRLSQEQATERNESAECKQKCGRCRRDFSSFLQLNPSNEIMTFRAAPWRPWRRVEDPLGRRDRPPSGRAVSHVHPVFPSVPPSLSTTAVPLGKTTQLLPQRLFLFVTELSVPGGACGGGGSDARGGRRRRRGGVERAAAAQGAHDGLVEGLLEVALRERRRLHVGGGADPPRQLPRLRLRHRRLLVARQLLQQAHVAPPVALRADEQQRRVGAAPPHLGQPLVRDVLERRGAHHAEAQQEHADYRLDFNMSNLADVEEKQYKEDAMDCQCARERAAVAMEGRRRLRRRRQPWDLLGRLHATGGLCRRRRRRLARRGPSSPET
ncbi:LOW QUALITY PROTEIN: Protein of unknown function [Gryllus bimaculatus]|nr:LOW QUALITY PROTEIN: Protein of unknown function [Gryllus bimaculatus]